MSAEAGWYRDPSVAGQLRYFDGANWTEHIQQDPQSVVVQQVAPAPQHFTQPQQTAWPAQESPAASQFQQPYQQVQQVQINQISVAPQQTKSVGVALLLTFFFGPLGMLYSTVSGGLIMMAINLVLGTLTVGLWFIVAWPIQMIWAAVAASNANKATAPTVTVAGAAPSYAPQAQYIPQTHGSPIHPQPGNPQQPQAALPQSTGPDLGQFAPQPTEPAQMPQAPDRSSTWYK